MAKKLSAPRLDALVTFVPASSLRKGDVVLVEAGDDLPGNGEVIEGVASVDERTIAGAPAQVVRESNGDHRAVSAGTRGPAKWLMVRITAKPGETFLDRVISMAERIKRQKTCGLLLGLVNWNWTGYAAAMAITAAVTFFGLFIYGRDEPVEVVLLYLLGIVLISRRFNFGASLLGAILSIVLYSFIFVPPFLDFSLSNTWRFGTFGVLLLVAVVISSLTHRIRVQMEVVRNQEKGTAALYAMSRELVQMVEQEGLIDVAVRHLGEVFESRVVLFTPNQNGHLSAAWQMSRGATLSAYEPDMAEAGLLHWVWQSEREAGLSMSEVAGLYLPLVSSRGKVGILRVLSPDRTRFEDIEQRRLLNAFATQLAMAIERVHLAEEKQQAHLKAEQEQLRNTMLSSVSHDLRTPLAAMTGAASTLIEDEAILDVSTRRELLKTIYEETERLNRLVHNLLNMSRLESGAVSINKEWQPLEEVVGTALQQMDKHIRGREVRIELADDLPLVPLDAVLVEQALVNLIENALKFSPEGSPIEVRAEAFDQEVVVEVADRGSGIPPGEEERIFEKFYRAPRDKSASGVGLGLAICRAIGKIHGGRVWVENRPAGGASFKFTLPLKGSPFTPPLEPLPEMTE